MSKWGLNPTDGHPCAACGERPTVGVGYGEGLPDPFGRPRPAETKWWCSEHFPREFLPPRQERPPNGRP